MSDHHHHRAERREYNGRRASRSRSHSRSRYSSRRSFHRSRSPSPRRNNRYQGGGGGGQGQENPGPNKCLGVFGLSLRTTERDLREVFSRYGPINECTVVIDAQTGRSRGFAFIYFESIEDAKAGKESCNGIEIDNRRIRVDFSITQRAHTPTPGIYMGKPTYRRGGYNNRDNRRRSPSPYRRRSRHSRSRSYSPRKYR